MRFNLLFLALLLPSFSFAQVDKDCEQVLSKKINYNFNNENEVLHFLNDFYKLTACGLDSIDLEIFSSGSIMSMFIAEFSSKSDTTFTFQYLYEKIVEVKKTNDFKQIYNQRKVLNKLSEQPADINNWEEDSLLLSELHLPDEVIRWFYEYLQENSNSNLRYNDVIVDYKKENNQKENVEEAPVENILYYPGNVNYDDLLNEAVAIGKPLLIYFTCNTCLNARKMEHHVLRKKSVQEKLLKDLHFISLYVDDREVLPENERTQSKVYDKKNKYVGDKHLDLQETLLNEHSQPYFIIVDGNGEIINEIGFTYDVDEFIKFLNF